MKDKKNKKKAQKPILQQQAKQISKTYQKQIEITSQQPNKVTVPQVTVITQSQQPIQQKIVEQNIVNKQQSLDQYLELKFSDNLKQSYQYKTQDKTQIQNNKNAKLIQLVSLDDQQGLLPFNLQPSPKHIKPLIIELLSYRTTTFMTVSTQIFLIKIQNINNSQKYEIQRRYSDFVDLYQQLFYNQPGYILYPFPEKSLESFLKIKLGLTNQLGEKSELIEKRMKYLQDFISWLAQHKQLCTSQQYKIFVNKDLKQYEEGKNRLNKYAEQHKSLEVGSQLKNFIGISKSIISSYFVKNGQHNNSHNVSERIQYQSIITAEATQYIKSQKQKLSNMLQQTQLLLKAQKSFSQFITLDTDNDILLKFCAKHSSAKQFYKKFSDFIQVSFFEEINLYNRMLEEAQKSLIHRAQLIQAILTARKQLNLQRKQKLQRLLNRAQRNFEADWGSFSINLSEKLNIANTKFKQQWILFKTNMKKIWKASKESSN